MRRTFPARSRATGSAGEATRAVFEAARRSGVLLPTAQPSGALHEIIAPSSASAVAVPVDSRRPRIIGAGASPSLNVIQSSSTDRQLQAREYARHLLRLQVNAKHRSQSPGSNAVSRAIAEATRPKSPSVKIAESTTRRPGSPSRTAAAALPTTAKRDGSPSGPALNVLTTPAPDRRRPGSPAAGNVAAMSTRAQAQRLPRPDPSISAASSTVPSLRRIGDPADFSSPIGHVSTRPAPVVLPKPTTTATAAATTTAAAAADESSKPAAAEAPSRPSATPQQQPVSAAAEPEHEQQQQQAAAGRRFATASRTAMDAPDAASNSSATPVATPVVVEAATAASASSSSVQLDFGDFAPKRRSDPAASTSPGFAQAAEVVSSFAATATTTATPEASSNVWAELRAQELAARREQEAEVERRRVDDARRELLKAQEAEWIASRPRPKWAPADEREYNLVHSVYSSQGWHASLAAFAEVVKAKGSTKLFEHAAGSISCFDLPRAVAPEVFEKVSTVLRDRRVADESWVALRLNMLRNFDPARAEKEFREQPPSVLARFTLGQLAWGVRVVAASGDWERAAELCNSVQRDGHDPFGVVDLGLIAGLPSRDRAAKARLFELTHLVEQRLRTKLSEIGKRHIVSLMLAYGRAQRHVEVRRLYSEVSQRGDVDQHVASAMLRYSTTPQVRTLLPQLQAAGVNAMQPKPIGNAMIGMISRGESDAALALYDELRAASPDAWSPRLVAAVLLLIGQGVAVERLVNEVEVGCGIVYGPPQQVPARLRRRIIAALADVGRYEDAVSRFDDFAEADKAFFGPYTGERLNRALVAVGRAPIAIAHADDEEVVGPTATRFESAPVTNAANVASPAAAAAASSGDGTADSSAPQQQQQIPQAETLLQLAKDREWEQALEVLQSVDAATRATAPKRQLTLLYNCALSAAVEVPSVVDALLADMAGSNVERNTTTYNTVMSAYARDDERWPEAVAVFEGLPSEQRDSSTLSVALSVFGKRAMWQHAAGILATARATKSKMNPVQYSLVVQASHKNHWETALSAFCDLRKHHGADAVKELVVNRVVKALELGGREADVPLVFSAMKAKGKGGKKEQPGAGAGGAKKP